MGIEDGALDLRPPQIDPHGDDSQDLSTGQTVSPEVPFTDVILLHTHEDAYQRYQSIANDLSASLEDKVSKHVHDFALHLWRIPADMIDEAFYKKFVRSADAAALYYKAKRFVAATTKSADEIRRCMSRTMDRVMANSDPNLKVYRTKLRTHYTLLLKSHALLSGCLDVDAAAAFRALESVTITDAVMREQLTSLKAAMDPGEQTQLYKMLELKDTASDFVYFRKVFACAFGFTVERKHDDKRTRAWHQIDIKQDWLRDMVRTYEPACMSVDRESESVMFPGPRFKTCQISDVPLPLRGLDAIFWSTDT